ncbi:pirin family protein [Helicobacter salomonis]|uniref:pirin family protein n=1 Tax=Helicobacter salomonis TaxID=56878 RepID=UPI0018F863A7|nr:pirin family protein [Helicobacter salomonis]
MAFMLALCSAILNLDWSNPEAWVHIHIEGFKLLPSSIKEKSHIAIRMEAGGVIKAKDVQWMSAGAGIPHEEFHSKEFSQTEGSQIVQLWVNFPKVHKNPTKLPSHQCKRHSQRVYCRKIRSFKGDCWRLSRS